MSNEHYQSIVYKGEYPETYIPERLRSVITIKRFWYLKLWGFIHRTWLWVTSLFKKAPDAVAPPVELQVEAEAEPVPDPEQEGGAK